MLRIVGELKPQYVVFENVPPLLKYRHRVDNDLRKLGYGAIWQTMAAEDVGAPHRRLRVWVLAVRGLAQWELLPRPSAQGDLFAPWVDAEAADGLWPTATVNGNRNRAGLTAKSGDGLATALKQYGSGTPNPTWVELLMGYPVGWTDLDDDASGAHAWPSGRGEQQHEHEPPRLVPPKSVRNRGARLKALGNAVVPQCAEAAILRALAAVGRSRGDG